MLKLLAVFDSAVSIYEQPFFMRSRGEAVRSWIDVTNDQKTKFWAHPADYTLFEIGEYDDQTGTVHMHEAKVNLGSALEMRSRAANSPRQPVPALADETEGAVKPEELAATDGLSETGKGILTSLKQKLSKNPKERSVN